MRHLVYLFTMAAMLAMQSCATCPPSQTGQLIADWNAQRPAKGLSKDMSMKEAECMREALVAELRKSQGRIIGYKAGLTSKPVQERFGHNAPVRGILLEKMLLADGAEVSAKFAARPIFEADLMVEVKDEGINQAKTPAEVLKHIAKIYPFIELPDLVVADGEPLNGRIITAINVGARFGVLGKAIAPNANANMLDLLANMDVIVQDKDGYGLSKGPGKAILGHPLNAVIWLAEDIAKSGGKLKAGDMLSLGSFMRQMPPKPGMTVKVTYEGLSGNPAVTVRFK